MKKLYFQLIQIFILTIPSIFYYQLVQYIKNDYLKISQKRDLSAEYHVPSPDYLWIDNNKECYECFYNDIFNNEYFLIHVGTDIVARTCDSSNVLPGKAQCDGGNGHIWVGINNGEVRKDKFQMLLMNKNTNYYWVSASNGHIPSNALKGGKKNSETLYIGRTYYDNYLVPGRIVPSEGKIFITMGGQEISFHIYEILVYDKNN
ncbi:hypothetical protein HCN44_001106 [Aphidius gifuensis]|uniref:Uncharacterized protein n=1 Tax=Aphidius gifuensis TaxID=684658 RepID=A0A835CNV9_APHGI|nr:hypothetical protein HCN44_001106 [Aphidius gifuensis]